MHEAGQNKKASTAFIVLVCICAFVLAAVILTMVPQALAQAKGAGRSYAIWSIVLYLLSGVAGLSAAMIYLTTTKRISKASILLVQILPVLAVLLLAGGALLQQNASAIAPVVGTDETGVQLRVILIGLMVFAVPFAFAVIQAIKKRK